MEIYVNPEPREWEALLSRSRQDDGAVEARVERIVERVRTEGDRALVALAGEIDGVTLSGVEVSADEIREAETAVSGALKEALKRAAANIEKFHAAQFPRPVEVETVPGVRCIQRPVPIRRVGLYVPGGLAPLFSTVLMLAVPARVAGCPEVVLCTPPDKTGRVAPEILYAASLCGVTRVFKAGGAQAVAAMAYGTESVPKVDKIFGPGNRYVTRAKQLVSTSQVAIDMPAGPSEVMVMADETARPDFVAADLLSQAEHGPDSQAVLLCTSRAFAERVSREVESQLASLPRGGIARQALDGSRLIVMDTPEEMVRFANAYAAEHLIVSMENPWEVASRITAAGSVFIGNYTPESAGDYASGTNHTLPTSGWARAFSGVNTDSFLRKITYQEITREGLAALGGTIMTMAEGEGLAAHRNAVAVRLSEENL